MSENRIVELRYEADIREQYNLLDTDLVLASVYDEHDNVLDEPWLAFAIRHIDDKECPVEFITPDESNGGETYSTMLTKNRIVQVINYLLVGIKVPYMLVSSDE